MAWLECRKHSDDEGTIYFVESAGFVKIGYTNATARERLRAFQTSSPLDFRVLVTTHGDTDLERKLHDLFKDQHHRGEWFLSGGPLNELVVALRGAPLGKIRRRSSTDQLRQEAEEFSLLSECA